MKKLTKREKFGMLLSIEEVAKNEILVEFINHELELLDKKNTSSKDGLKKPTATQLENEKLMEIILEVLEDGKPNSITDIQNKSEELKGFSNQKMSALMKKLVDSQKVEKYLEKRKTFFKKL